MVGNARSRERCGALVLAVVLLGWNTFGRLGHEFRWAIHGFIADGAGAGGPFAVFVEKEFPEALLHAALLAIWAGKGRGPALEIGVVRRVAGFQPEVCREGFLFGAFGILPEVRA